MAALVCAEAALFRHSSVAILIAFGGVVTHSDTAVSAALISFAIDGQSGMNAIETLPSR
jgi:ABC-type sulfate/molybdate transport systems ATPase subunit